MTSFRYIFGLMLFVNFFHLSSFGQLQVGVGPAAYLDADKQKDLVSYDYTFSMAYQLKKFDLGLEFIQNNYRSDGRGKLNYHFYQYQLFGRYFPLKQRSLFLKIGTNLTDEYAYKNISGIEVTENGTLMGYEGGLGYQDKLIKKSNIYINASITYNYLFLLKDGYYYAYKKVPIPFYALKISFIYQFNSKKK